MRDNYFTNINIDKKAKRMLLKLKEFRERHPLSFKPECAALLVIDMQRYFLDRKSHAFLPSALPIIPRIRKLRDAFLKINRPVIFTQHINTEKDAKMLKNWWRDLITKKNLFYKIHPELFCPDSLIVKKSQYDAFYKTNLEMILKKKEISQIVITGVMTHLCCETTARSAFMRGFGVFFCIDGTATEHESFHTATLLNLSHGFAVIVLINELLEIIYEEKA